MIAQAKPSVCASAVHGSIAEAKAHAPPRVRMRRVVYGAYAKASDAGRLSPGTLHGCCEEALRSVSHQRRHRSESDTLLRF